MRSDHIERVYEMLTDADSLMPGDLAGAGSGSAARIAHLIGADRSSVHRGLERLHAAGRAHIHCWVTTAGTAHAAVWIRGPGENVERPSGRTREEKNRVKREKRRQANGGELLARGRRDGDDTRQARSIRQADDTVARARRQPRTWYSSLESA